MRRERLGACRVSARQAPAALAVALRVSSASADVAVASRLSGDAHAGSAAAIFCVCVAFSLWLVRGACGSRVNGGGGSAR